MVSLERWLPAARSTHLPGFRPVRQVVVIDAPFQRYMLSDPYSHILCWRHIHYRRVARVGIGNPHCDGESVGGAAKDDRQGAHEVEEERREAIFVGWNGDGVRAIGNESREQWYSLYTSVRGESDGYWASALATSW